MHQRSAGTAGELFAAEGFSDELVVTEHNRELVPESRREERAVVPRQF